jgi:hypothetical protein
MFSHTIKAANESQAPNPKALTASLVIGRRHHSIAVGRDTGPVGRHAKSMGLDFGISRMVLEVVWSPTAMRSSHGAESHVATAARNALLEMSNCGLEIRKVRRALVCMRKSTQTLSPYAVITPQKTGLWGTLRAL